MNVRLSLIVLVAASQLLAGPAALAQIPNSTATNQVPPTRWDDDHAHIERLDMQVKGFEDRLGDIYKVISGIGGLVAFLAVWSFIRDFHQRKDYKTERDFYQQRALAFEERQERSLTHALRVSSVSSGRESKLSKQQLELGEGVLARSGEMLTQQMDNIRKVGDVIDLVKTTFEDQKKAQKEQMEATKTSTQANEKVADLLKGFRKKYAHSAKQLLTFESVKAIAWPGLLETDKSLARRARTSLDAVMGIVSLDEEQHDPYTFARVLQLMGITAFYDNEIDAALEYLEDSIKVYLRHPQRNEDIMARAYSKHFLGVCEKNWQVVGAPEESNFETAERLLDEAYEVSKTKPKNFLIPVTLAEIQSYRTTGQCRREASGLLDEVIHKMEKLKQANELDDQQRVLLPRSYLMRGNLHFYAGNFADAAKCYESAGREDDRNPFPVLSLAQLEQDSAKAKPLWEKGLMVLEQPKGALQKQELTNKVSALAWAVLAARALNNDEKAGRYGQELDKIGASIREVCHPPRKPLFFSPMSKTLVDFARLKKEIFKS